MSSFFKTVDLYVGNTNAKPWICGREKLKHSKILYDEGT